MQNFEIELPFAAKKTKRATAKNSNDRRREPPAAKRKAAAAICELVRPASKKRVTLGDLTNAVDTSEKPVSRILKRKGKKLDKPNAPQPREAIRIFDLILL